MSKTIALAIAVTAFAGLVAAAPAQAATRSVDISIERFVDRCIEQGGALADTNPSFSCETPDTVVACSFYTINYAECAWDGIENQLAVNRIIGMPDSVALNEGSGGSVKKGGGFKLPDLPIKWK